MCLKRGWRRREDESHMGSSLSHAMQFSRRRNCAVMQSDVQDPGRLQESTANQNIPSHNYGPGYQGMDQARSARPTLPTGTPESPGKGSWKKQEEEAE
ncbi:hypothetical protein TEQG_05428 [Trichophyton equinum CBS 127.97]|uniref:Uncharacterized protein n=1 Tax=Trichophyton equinum (strain ATCC MYA-4606 / CBS 127.97) TaxID=559882 RepID=F2PX06_TRIEC|nr:hypothetical protein TEQG_05428 [Trichophyton equinum CBS 127.97]